MGLVGRAGEAKGGAKIGSTGPAPAGPIKPIFYLLLAFHFTTAAMVFSTCMSGFIAVYS
jgi:hypothetical protein